MVTQDIIALIQKRLDDDGTDFDATAILRELRVASAELAADSLFKRVLFPTTSSTITLVSGTAIYALPSDFANYIEQVVYNPTSANSRRLLYIEPDQIYDYNYQEGSIVGFYSVRGSNLVLAGTPSTDSVGLTLEVQYSMVESASSYANDGTETVLGKNCPQLLIDRVVYQLALSSQEQELTAVAREAKENFKDNLEKKRIEFEELGARGPHFMDVADDFPLGG